MSLRYHTRYPHVDVEHNNHRNKERTHGRKYYVARIFIVGTVFFHMAIFVIPEIENVFEQYKTD